MEASVFYGVIVGALIGWVIGQVLLVFFMEEIFNGIDLLREKVRGLFGLDA